MDLRVFKVSVIIPVYNNEKFIGPAIDSVLEQEFPPEEIIVVDDGSTDKTPCVLGRYKDRVKVVTIVHSGVSHARNVGIDLASGEWLSFLDADDRWLKDKLKEENEAVSRHPGCGFFCSDYQIFDHQSAKVLRRYPDFRRDPDVPLDVPWNAFKSLIKKNFVGTTSVALVKKELVMRAGKFNDRYRIAQDYDLWLRLALITPFVFLPVVLVEKRVHDANVTKNLIGMGMNHENILISVRDKHKAYLKANGLWGISSLALAEKKYEIGNLFYECSRKKKAFGYYFSGLLVSLSWRNIAAFFYVFSRKLIRSLSFGLIRKRTVNLEHTCDYQRNYSHL